MKTTHVRLTLDPTTDPVREWAAQDCHTDPLPDDDRAAWLDPDRR